MEEELTEEVELAKRRIDEINIELNQVQKGTHLLILLGVLYDQDCVVTAEMILATGDGETWRWFHWQAGEQPSAAQSWNYGEH